LVQVRQSSPSSLAALAIVHLHNIHLLDIAAAFIAANRMWNMRRSSQGGTALIGEDPPVDTEKTQGVKVEFNNVSFKYPMRNVAMLDELTMSVSISQILYKASNTNFERNRSRLANLRP